MCLPGELNVVIIKTVCHLYYLLFALSNSATLHSPLNWLLIVIVINVMIGGFSGEHDIISSCNCLTTGVQLQQTVHLQLYGRAKYSSLCNNHI